MRKELLLCILSSYLLVNLSAKSMPQYFQEQSHKKVQTEYSQKEWRPASYKGLLLGRATRDDMLKVLGKPKLHSVWDGWKEDDPKAIIDYIYHDIDEFPGPVFVEVENRSGKVIHIEITPKNLSREDAIAHFGGDYITTHYSLCRDAEGEAWGVAYKNPKGELTFLEYRDRGIALDLNKEGKVERIRYQSKPIGLESEGECKEEFRLLSQRLAPRTRGLRPW